MRSPHPSTRPVAVYYHTHWDREWYLPFRTYQIRLANVVDELLARLESQELPCFMLDGQTVVLEDYLELRPQNRERLKKLIQAGKITIGPWYVMPDEFLVGGESLLRNLRYGIQESRHWGCTQFTGYLPDTFGHSADMPLLFQQCGISSAVVWRGIHPTQNIFTWSSPSGEKVLTLHLTDGYFQMTPDDWTLTAEQKAEALQTLLEKLHATNGCPSDIGPLLPVGADHMGVVSFQGRQWLLSLLPNLTETTPERYLETVQTHCKSLPQVEGELSDNSGSFLLPGVYSSRLYLKQENRRLEHLLVHQLEPLLAMAQTLLLPQGQPHYPHQELALAWKTLILNHPHDSICGCSVDAVHRENEVRFDQVRQMAEALQQETLYRLEQAYAKPDHWLLWNTSEQPYTGVVEVTEDVLEADTSSAITQPYQETRVLQEQYQHNIRRIPMAHLTQVRRTGWVWAEGVPSLGVQTMPYPQAVSSAGAFTPVSVVDAYHLRNGIVDIQVEKDGTLTVKDLASGVMYANLLQFQSQGEQGDSYNSAPIPGKEPSRAVLLDARIEANGPLVGILELTHQLRQPECVLTTLVQLMAGSAVVTFKTSFVNRASHQKVQVGFATGQPIEAVCAESHFSQVQRTYDPNYREIDHMPVARMKELKTNTGPVQRFFSANGHSWITEGLTEYEVVQDRLWITLLRTFDVLSKADSGVRGAQAGPPLETPEGACLNRTLIARYAWLPTPNSDETAMAVLYQATRHFYGSVKGAYRGPELQDEPTTRHVQSALLPQETSSGDGVSMIQWDAPALVGMACYWLPGRGLVVRVMNTRSQPVQTDFQTGFAYRHVHQVNFLDEIQVKNLSLPLTIPPNAVMTLLFEG